MILLIFLPFPENSLVHNLGILSFQRSIFIFIFFHFYFISKFQDFDRKPQDTFTLSDGSVISFVDYFKTKYNISLKDPDQPMIVNRPKVKTSHEQETTRLIVLVPEQCYLTGLTDVSGLYTFSDDVSLQ